MKSHSILLLLALVPMTLVPPAVAQPVHTHGHAHASAGHDAAFHVPADHVRWAPDAALLEGMARIRQALHDLAPHEIRPLSDTTVIALADEIDAAIQYLFANCRLDPEPDAALHRILARLMADSRALHADPSDSSPLAGMQAALNHYAALFDDPNALHPH
ncbi:DnrO protein [Xanthomonadaceae bacterium JHOS43]|nr:DnrO protein [Xanthomonadaceae bacterium JHOS43]MCX7562935.1 DnrO protein [Xanthomonadaceae bacterium XH05]